MRGAVFGDVHGNLAALTAVLAAVRDSAAERILCTGDLVNYGPEPAATLALALDAADACVAGNHDRLLTGWRPGQALVPRPGRDMAVEEACLRWTADRLGAAERGRLAALPADARLEVCGAVCLLAHGSPESADEYVTADLAPARWRQLARLAGERGAAVVILGHTHRPLCVRREGVLFCNPGSVGWPKDGDPRAAWALLTLDGRGGARWEVRREAYDAAATSAAMRRAGLPVAVAEAVAAGRPA